MRSGYISGYATVKHRVQTSEVYNPHPLKGIPRNGTRLVTAGDAAWTHRQMNLRAAEFKKEAGLELAPWTYLNHGVGRIETEQDVYARGYLFGDHQKKVVGACAFRLHESVWVMQWAWFTPRGWLDGHLRATWNHFRNEYGDFLVLAPVMPEMKDFLLKNTINR